jgi:tetratricopeptide (TPR) repeat protein
VAEGSRVFVGRVPILTALRAAVDTALTGAPQLVLLAGEPGIGKTALAEQTTAYATDQGATMAWGACWVGDGVPAFWPWRQVLGDLGAAHADTAALLEASGDDGEAAPDDARFRMFGAVSQTLAAAAAGGLVIVLDDLHWADPGSLRLLAFVIRHVRSARLLVLGTLRDVDPAPNPDLRDFLAGVAAQAATYAVSGLGEAEVATLLSTVAGAVSPATAEAVFRRSGGNPLLAQEIGRLLATEGDAGLAAVPVAARDTIGQRLNRLSPGLRDTLAAAAILGQRFDIDLLVEVSGRASAASDVDVVVRERIVTPLTGGHDAEFAHDLFRETVLADLDAVTRRQLHRRAGEALRRQGGHPAEVAFHLERALPEVDPRQVVEASVSAARDATRRLAYEEALLHLRRATRLASQAESGPLWLEFGHAARRAGEFGEARRAYLRVAEETSAEMLAQAALGLHQLGTSSEQSHHEVIDLLEGALAALSPPAASGLSARVLAALARERADGFDADRERAVGLAEQAVSLARSAGDPRTLAFCLFAQHDVVWGPGTAALRLRIAHEMEQAAGDDPELAFEATFCRFIALVDLGDVALEVALRDMQRLAESSSLPRQRFYVTSRMATLAMLRGEYESALCLIEEADRLGTMIGHPDALGVRMTQLLVLGLTREGPAAVPRLEEDSHTVAPAEFAPEMRAFTALANGERDVAAAIIRASEPATRRARFRWRVLSALAFDAEIAVAAGAPDLCQDLYDAITPYADEVVDIGGATAVLGPASFYLGLLAQGSGRADRAAQHFGQALDVARRIGAAPLVARIEAAIGTAAGVTGEFRRADGGWRLRYAGTTVNVSDAKGLHDIAALLAVPGTDVPALHLLAGAAGIGFGSDEVLDDTARTAYQKRLAEIDDALDHAAVDDDHDRVQALSAERASLIDALSAAVGLGGRSRRLGDPGERARTTVTARIRDALRKIDQRHPALAAHLRDSLVTGRVCRYQPPSAVRWTL